MRKDVDDHLVYTLCDALHLYSYRNRTIKRYGTPNTSSSLSLSRNLTLRLFCVLDSTRWVQMLKCAILNLFDGALAMDISFGHHTTFAHSQMPESKR